MDPKRDGGEGERGGVGAVCGREQGDVGEVLWTRQGKETSGRRSHETEQPPLSGSFGPPPSRNQHDGPVSARGLDPHRGACWVVASVTAGGRRHTRPPEIDDDDDDAQEYLRERGLIQALRALERESDVVYDIYGTVCEDRARPPRRRERLEVRRTLDNRLVLPRALPAQDLLLLRSLILDGRWGEVDRFLSVRSGDGGRRRVRGHDVQTICRLQPPRATLRRSRWPPRSDPRPATSVHSCARNSSSRWCPAPRATCLPLACSSTASETSRASSTRRRSTTSAPASRSSDLQTTPTSSPGPRRSAGCRRSSVSW